MAKASHHQMTSATTSSATTFRFKSPKGRIWRGSTGLGFAGGTVTAPIFCLLHFNEHSQQSYQNLIIQVRRITMYSPKIDEDYIPFLYRKAKSQQIPMTRLVNKIIEEYLMQNRLVTILEEDKTTHNNLMSASL
jgi:hypothetical protein